MAYPGVMSVRRLDPEALDTLKKLALAQSPPPRPEYSGAYQGTMYRLTYIGAAQVLTVLNSPNTLRCDTAKVSQFAGFGDLDSPNPEGVATYSPPMHWLYDH